MKRTILLAAFLALPSAFAADMPKPDLYVIEEEVIKPGAMASYEAAGKDFVAAFALTKLSSPALIWNAYVTDDLHYLYVFPIANFAALDSSQDDWEKVRMAMGADRWSSLERRASNSLVSYNKFVTMRRIDLSYVPANPRLKPGKSGVDVAAAEECVNAALGADVLPLQARAMAITRRFDRRAATYRPDLSHMVAAAAPK